MDNIIKAIRYQHPDRIPVEVSLVPAAWQRYGEKLNDIRAKYPFVFGEEGKTPYTREEIDTMPDSYRAGSYTDCWGCRWENVNEGYESIVVGHPLPEREDVWKLQAPAENDEMPHGFMFLRLFDLRGWEEMMIDFFEEPPELTRLIDIVCDYNVRQMQLLCDQNVDGLLWVGDDNGIQHSMPIHPDLWRKYIKPAYKKIFDVAHRAGKIVYFHTDGCIHEVMPDMQEVGADIINCQFRANGLDHLKRVCKGKIPIDLDLDRQMFPFATPEQIRDHIWHCCREMYLPEGGLILSAECAADVPLENIDMICRTLNECAQYKG